MPIAEHLLFQTEKKKKKTERVFYKNAVFENFAIFTGKHHCEIFKNTYLEEYLHMAASELTSQSDCLKLCFWIAFKMILT